MKKTIAICISGLLLAGGLNAEPMKRAPRVGLMAVPQYNSTKVNLNFAPKKSKGGVWQEGDMVFAAGIGFPNWGKTWLKAVQDATNATDYKVTGFGPLHFRFEYALSETWGIGASSNFATYGDSWTESGTNSVWNSTTGQYDNVPYTYHYSDKVTAVNFLVRFNKHWAAGSKADIFSGTGLGYSFVGAKWESDDPNSTSSSYKSPFPVGFESTIGVRIFFSDNIAGYIEAGWAKDIIQGGICYKIGG